MSRGGGKARRGFVFERKGSRKKEHGVPSTGPRGVDQACRGVNPSSWWSSSLTGLATRRDDVVRAEAARSVEEPDPAEITPEHAEILVSHDRHVQLDVDVSFGETDDVRGEVTLDGVPNLQSYQSI